MKFCDIGKIAAAVFGTLTIAHPAFASEEQFKDSEIRVIKNKAFQKSLRAELGVNTSVVLNQSFIYTYMAGASLAFHINEQFGLYGEGAYGGSPTKSDCDVLGKNFNIDPIVNPIRYYAGGGLLYTPIYGKFQLSSGDVLYFDTFFFAGGGVVGITQRERYCTGGTAVEQTISGTQISAGGGQRYFLSENVSIDWRLKFLKFGFNNPNTGEEAVALFGKEPPSISLSIGVGYFL